MRNKKFCHYCGRGLTRKRYEGQLRLFCDYCREPVYENPVPATCLVVVDEKARVLLVKRSVEPQKGFWCLPGGFMELDEAPEHAALRELMEETGLKGRIEMLLGVSTNPSAQYHTVLMVGYLVKSYSGNLTAGDDANDVNFFHFDELPDIAFKSHASFIRLYYALYSD